MSIEPNENSAQARVAEAEAGAGQETAAKSRERRIFICYPRSLINDVGDFHSTLLERLRTFSRSYVIFRDEGPERGERLTAGENWRQAIHKKLDGSQCCLIVLVPAIFESAECAKEVEYFAELIKRDSSRFFYPIMFVRLDDADIAAHYESGNSIARILKDDELDIRDFSGGWAEPDKKIYRAKLHQIAEELNDHFALPSPQVSTPSSPQLMTLAGLGAAGVNSAEATTAELGTGAEPRPERRWWPWLAAAALLVAIIGGWLVLPPPAPATFEDVSAPIRLLAPAETFTNWVATAPKARPLEAGMLPGQASVAHLREATIDGIEWYEVELNTGEKRYLPKSSIPVWESTSLILEALEPIQTFKAPQDGAEPAAKLAPGNLVDSDDDGSLMQANVSGEMWYAAPRAEGSNTIYVFFPAGANSNKLVQWTSLETCLATTQQTTASYRPVDGLNDAGDFSQNEAIQGDIQKAIIKSVTWFRFRDAATEHYRYLKSGVVTEAKCTPD